MNAAEIERLKDAHRGEYNGWADYCVKCYTEDECDAMVILGAYERLVARLRSEHLEILSDSGEGTCCMADLEPYPCPTIVALDSPEITE